MYQGRKPTYRRTPQRPAQPEEPRGRQSARRQLWEEEIRQEEPAAWNQPYDQPEPGWDEPYRPYDEPDPAPTEIIATNRVVCLSATLAAMCSLFGLFLLFAEKKSRAIRLFAVQSVGLSACHLILGAAALLVGLITGAVPYIGFLMNLACWIVYLAGLVVMLCLRVRMMLCAWQGIRYGLPVIGRWLEKFC